MYSYWLCAGASGVFWMLTYLLVIKRGFQDKACGIPMYALALNISWECIYAFVTPSVAPQVYINVLWFAFDLVILYHLIRNYRKDYPDASPKAFYPYMALVFIVAFLVVLAIQRDGTLAEFINLRGSKNGMGTCYSAFGMNLIMSVLFIEMILRRKSVSGQSIWIALFKLLGTLFADLGYVFTPYPNAAHPAMFSTKEMLWPVLFSSILVFDAIYLVLVWRQCRKEGINPWKRA
jgi:hypothetical protein